MQQEPTQEQQQLHPNCTFVCITEDINGGSVEVTSFNSDTTTLDEAKEWIDENQSSGHSQFHLHHFDFERGPQRRSCIRIPPTHQPSS